MDSPFVLTAYLTDTIKKGRHIPLRRNAKIWHEAEGDYLEVIFEQLELSNSL